MLELSGARVPWTVRQLETWIKQLHPDLVFISETKCRSRRIDNLRGRFGMFGVRVDAREWDQNGFGNVHRWIRDLEENIIRLSTSPITEITKTRTAAIRAKLEELREREELLCKQRGKMQWLKEEDHNTADFHHRASSRYRKNSIQAITDDQGNKHTNKQDIQSVITQHFDSLFRSSNLSTYVINETLNTVMPMVNSEMNDMLLLPFTPDEVKCALHQMYPYKSLRPDEVLSRMIQYEEARGVLQGIAVSRNGPRVTWGKVCRSKVDGGLDFRDLRAFNRAMLSRQLWQIIMRLDSLISWIFRYKYFPNSDMSSAKIATKASYTWRPLVEARDLIEAGSWWRVGSGASIRLLEDHWLLRPLFFFPTTSNAGWRKGAAVTSLMDDEGAGWDAALVRALFPPHDADSNLEVPVQGYNSVDSLTWHYDLRGKSTVRNVYCLALTIDEAAHFEHKTGSTSAKSPDWKFNWTAKVPPKVQLFARRMCKQAVPTLENLARRGVKDLGGYPRNGTLPASVPLFKMGLGSRTDAVVRGIPISG
ncbi:UNVERIFIED_CONTAM: hypothetical protein Slati_3507100 [Sesamum latifolium]|uniref:Reverse transcriptase zinc-binding domain-containing protein n=1 Tax=Sesamum latifolium TaxID=2727402 RepID=A0AAW2UJA4_9LAMI